MRGRKPTPTQLKIVRGNPGKRPINKNEPRPKAATAPRVPPDLQDGEAKNCWRRVGKILAGMRVLTEADLDLLRMYCDTWARYVDARTQVNKSGLVVRQGDDNQHIAHNPFFSIENKMREQLLKMQSELGLTPSSRSRLVVPQKPNENDKPDSPFSGFSNRGKG